nr:NADH dehydrogenase subunit 4 [Proceratium itoi]
MMKIFFLVIFMMFMMMKNKLLMFYYNLCYMLSFVMLFFMCKYGESIYLSISFYFGNDYYSYMLNLMSIWILGLMFMTLEEKTNKFKLVFLIIMYTLISAFFSMNLILFYLFFEVSLIPMFILVVYWGSNPERLSAAYYLLMYTLMISLPLYFYIMKMFVLIDSLDFYLLMINMSNKISFIEYIMCFFAFYIKMPVYFFHLWLPKAHVEAPVYGSMILAAVLLKLGGYGLIRFSYIFMKSCIYYNFIMFSVSIIGAIVVSLISLVQIDMKSLVAYSSVVHMNFMICAAMTMFKMGLMSGYMMMISHGLCSSGLFYMVTMWYKRSLSRLMMMNKGMINLLPIMMIWWFYLCSCNFSFPLSLNFISEIIMIISVMSWMQKTYILIMILSLMSSVYSIYIYSYVCHGELNLNSKFNSGSMMELMVLFLHSFPLLLMLLNLILWN